MSHHGKRFFVLLGSVFLIAVCLAIFLTGIRGNFNWIARKNDAEKNAATNSKNVKGNISCPLDGAMLTSLPQDRPLAVVIDDLPSVRPQSGLTSADIVYETLAEGGITRLLAIYYHGEAPRVGPVRSARPYFIQLAGGLNAVLIHAGGSPEALEYMKKHNVDHVDEFRFSRGFWRDPSRKAPHNLFSDTKTLHRLIQDTGLNKQVTVPGLNVVASAKDIDSTDDWLESERIEISFSKSNNLAYVYDDKEKVYRRMVGGKPHMDANTDTQISPRNIIVQFVNTKVVDEQGRLEMEIVGQGRALIFASGQVVEAVWKKAAIDKPISYEAVDNDMPEILPGQTWIEIVPQGTKLTF